MAPSHFRVRRLARDAGVDPEDAVLLLLDAGFSVEKPEDIVPRREAPRARDVLLSQRRKLSTTTQVERGDAFFWPHLRPTPIRYVSVETVEEIHTALTEEFDGTEDAVAPPGVKDRGLLESAVTRPATARDKYPNVHAAGAALVHALIHNHPFHNGNKRTALLSLVVFLERENQYFIDFDEDQLFEMIVATANHSLAHGADGQPAPRDHFYSDREVLAIHDWLVAHSSIPALGNYRIPWRKLEVLLTHLGCTVETKSNARKVRRGTLSVNTGARNPGTEMDPQEIRRIRRALQLDPEHGVDSHVFYGGNVPHRELADIIHRYRGVLQRLALLDRT